MTATKAEGKPQSKGTSEAVLEVKKNQAGKGDETITLSTGHRAIIRPVASSLIEAVSSKFPSPKIPMWENPEKGREEPNPGDPEYIREVEENERKRGRAVIEAMLVFGVDLVDGLPDDKEWMPKLKYLEKIEAIDLSVFDLEDEDTKELVFKKFVAVSNTDVFRILEKSGVSEEAIKQQMDGFQGNKTR